MPVQRVTAFSENSGDSDWFRVKLVAGHTYQLRLSSTNQAAVMAIMLPDGQQMRFPIAYANSANFVAPVSGDYFVSATSLGGPSVSLYTITVEDIADPIPASTATQRSLAVGGTEIVTGNNPNAGINDDWFAIDLVAGQSYVLAADDGDVYIVDGDGSLVAIEGLISRGGPQVHFTAPETGRFYAGVQLFATTEYQLSLLAIDDDHGDTPAMAGSLAVGASAGGRWESAGDDDAYAIVLSAGSSYAFSVQNLDDANIRGFIRILDESGALVWVSFTQDQEQSTLFSPGVDGTYYVVAGINAVSSPGNPSAYLTGWDYTLSAAVVAGDLTDNALTTGTLQIGGQAASAWEDYGDQDWLKVDLVEGQSYLFDLSTSSANGVGLALFDSDGNRVGASERLSDLSGFGALHHTAAATGSYFIAVLGGTDTGTYTISATAVADDYANNAATTGEVLNGAGEGVTEVDGDADWFAIGVTAGLTYKLTPDSAATVLTVRDADGVLLTAPGLDFTFTPSVTGAYFIEATGVAGDYSFTVTTIFDDYGESLATTGVIRTEIIGTDDPDTMISTDAYELLAGAAGDDLFLAGTGYDRFEGGAGTDTLSYAGSPLALEVDLRFSRSLIDGAQDDVINQIENVTGSAFDDLIAGNDSLNILRGEDGNDRLFGFGGDDFLVGGIGSDDMVGGLGDDTYYVDDTSDAMSEFAGEGNDRIAASISLALAPDADIERIEAVNLTATVAMDLTGSDIANTIYGNDGVNILRGQSGDDTLAGFGSDDFLVGGSGTDIMIGGLGNDTFYVDDAGDYAFEGAGEGTDRIAASVSYTLSNGSEIELLEAVNLTATTAFDLTGSDSANTIIGNNGVNILKGQGGNDVLIAAGGDDFLVGGTGDDAMHGGLGNDTYYVDAAGDTVSEAAGEGSDRVAASVSYTLAAGSEVETLEAVNGADTVAMNLTGNAGANAIVGNAGANILNGGLGADALTGLGGADSFAFTTALGAGNVDHITDFVSGTDKIGLDDAIFGALGAGAFAFGTQAGDADDRIVYDAATGNLFFDPDGAGGQAQMLFATLDTHPPLAAADFILI